MIDDIINAKTMAKFSQLKENKEDTSKAILDTVIESLAKLNEKKSDYNVARTYYTTPSLPTLKFPTFTGEYAKWTPWWNQFNAAIHSNARISPMDKFNFQNLDATPENYTAAIEILQSRYEKPDLLQASHVSKTLACGTRPLACSVCHCLSVVVFVLFLSDLKNNLTVSTRA